MKKIIEKIKLTWLLIKDNAPAIIAICAILTLFITISSCVRNKEANFSRRPDVKIKTPSLIPDLYQEYNGGMSYILRFSIPIKNEGEIMAYGVEIKTKDLDLIQEKYNLSTPSLQRTIYTNAPFNLKPDETIEDKILIDVAPVYMDKVKSGEKSFTLNYEIWYYADKSPKREPFVYQYEIKYSKGQFQNDSKIEKLKWNIKP